MGGNLLGKLDGETHQFAGKRDPGCSQGVQAIHLPFEPVKLVDEGQLCCTAASLEQMDEIPDLLQQTLNFEHLFPPLILKVARHSDNPHASVGDGITETVSVHHALPAICYRR